MCLVLVSWREGGARTCVLAANRDEFHARPTAPAGWWQTTPPILAGRDLVAGGTWLGITRGGRFAALTNFRGPRHAPDDAPSRGTLVTDFLSSSRTVAEQILHLEPIAARFNGFNLMFCDGARLGVFESTVRQGRELGPGIYGLSNHLLDTPWPKVERAKSGLRAALHAPGDTSALLHLLRDDHVPPDAELPATGIGLEWERLLSSAFIVSANYGTRCSTVIRADQHGQVHFDEWTWDPQGRQTAHHHDRFRIDAQAAAGAASTNNTPPSASANPAN